MAESVFIEGFSDDVLANLPDWAKDETLERILATLRRSIKVEEVGFKKLETALRQFSTGKSKSSDAPDPDKIGRYNKGLDTLLANVEEEVKQQKKRKKLNEEENEQRTAGTKLFGNMTKKAMLFDAAMVALDYTVAKAIGMMVNNVETFTGLYKAGINVIDNADEMADGFHALAQLSMLSGVRLGDLEKILGKFGNTVTVFGTGKLQKATTMAYKNMAALGYSASEALEFNANYLDAVKGFTHIQSLSTATVAASTSKFGALMKNISLTTGQSVNDLMVKFTALSKSTDAMILSSQLGQKGATDLLGTLSGISDESIRRELLSTMAAPLKTLDSTFTTLQAAGLQVQAQQYLEMTQRLKSAGTEQERIAIIKSFGETIDLTEVQMSQLKLQAANTTAANSAQSEESMKIVQKYKELGSTLKLITEDEQKQIDAANKTKESRDRVANAFNKIMVDLGKIFVVNIGFLDALGAGLEWVAKGTTWLAEHMPGWSGMFVVMTGAVVAFGAMIASIGFKIGFIFKDVGKSITRFGVSIMKLPYTIAKLPFQLVGALFGWLKTGLGKLFSGIDLKNMLPKLNIGGWFSELFASIGRAFGSIGTMLKGAFSNLLKPFTSLFSKGGSIFSSIFGKIGGWLGKIGGLFLRFLGPLASLYGAFEFGQLIGTYIHNMIKDFSWFQTGMDALFGWLDYILQFIPGQIGKDAKERIETKDKLKAMEEQDAKDRSEKTQKTTEVVNKEITAKVTAEPVAKEKPSNVNPLIYNPKPTTVNAVSGDSSEAAAMASAQAPAAGADIESIAKAAPVAKEPEINSILKYQTSLLEQQLDKIVDLLAINRDQLKIVRNAS